MPIQPDMNPFEFQLSLLQLNHATAMEETVPVRDLEQQEKNLKELEQLAAKVNG